MSENNSQLQLEPLSTKLDAQRLAISFLASAIAESMSGEQRANLQARLERWAEDAEMRGGEDLYSETANLMRLMAARVGETQARLLSEN